MEAGEANAHYQRLQGVKEGLPKDLGTFGAVGCGTDGYWWDYGQVAFYLKNNMIMAQDTKEAATMRLFFGVDDTAWRPDPKHGYGHHTSSVVMASDLKDKGVTIKASVVVGLTTERAEMNECLVVNVTAPSVKCGKGCVLYNVVSDQPIELADGEVLVGMETPEDHKYFTMRSSLSRDGKKDWKERHSSNPYSYKEVYELNTSADPSEIAANYAQRHAAAKRKLGVST